MTCGKTQQEIIELDRLVMKVYQSKMASCQQRGIPFNLTFASVKNLLRAKHCYYTGILLTRPDPAGNIQRMSDFSIDRIDCTRPYEKGNVVACSNWANKFKNYVESNAAMRSDKEALQLSFKAGEKVMKKTLKRIKSK